MAFKAEGTIKRFIGTSLDTKPPGVPPGSSFMETDTRKIYRYDGNVWHHAETVDEQLQTQQLILYELTQIRELLVGLNLT